jgi:hypothetical protein
MLEKHYNYMYTKSLSHLCDDHNYHDHHDNDNHDAIASDVLFTNSSRIYCLVFGDNYDECMHVWFNNFIPAAGKIYIFHI